MKKIGLLHKEDNEIPSISSYISEKANLHYGEVLKEICKMYFGRESTPEDIKRVVLLVDTFGINTQVVIDNKIIGSITSGIGEEGLDFERNKISFKITFTPANAPFEIWQVNP